MSTNQNGAPGSLGTRSRFGTWIKGRWPLACLVAGLITEIPVLIIISFYPYHTQSFMGSWEILPDKSQYMILNYGNIGTAIIVSLAIAAGLTILLAKANIHLILAKKNVLLGLACFAGGCFLGYLILKFFFHVDIIQIFWSHVVR